MVGKGRGMDAPFSCFSTIVIRGLICDNGLLNKQNRGCAMKQQIGLVLLGVCLGLIGSCFYGGSDRSIIPLDDGTYVDGQFFVFNNENGTRIIEKNKSGFQSRIFIPGDRYYEMMEKYSEPKVLDTLEGEILYFREFRYNAENLDIQIRFCKIEADQLTELPIKKTAASVISN
jgi:hypothetical protein